MVRSALTGIVLIGMTTNAFVRRRLATPALRRLAEWEIGVNVTIALTTAAAIGLGRVGRAPADACIHSGRVAAAAVIAAIVFVFRGGTFIVRSVLDKANASPRLSEVSGAAAVPRFDRSTFAS